MNGETELAGVGEKGSPGESNNEDPPEFKSLDKNWSMTEKGRPSSISLNPDTIFGVEMNPRVFFISLIAIWGFIIWANVDTDGCKEQTDKANGWITKQLGWVYVGGLTVFMIWSLYLAFSKYGNLRLAKDENVKPDFSLATWFSMLFSAGVGIGLFFYGVGEPVVHYGWAHRMNHYFMKECTADNTPTSCFTTESRHARSLLGMNIAWFHWGLAPSATYVAVGLPIAYYHYKHGLDLTMRTGLYPLIGNRINGWIGDLCEIFAIIGTMFGVCTSLGLGVEQITAGFQRLDSNITNETGGSTQIWIIWIVTLVATISVITGLEVGIRRISEVTFILGIIVMSMVFFMDNTWFILGFFTEMIGFHINNLPAISFASFGYETWVGIDKNDYAVQDKYTGPGLNNFGSNWTLFYWGWWISWAPFVGLFIARISKGRTIREFILGNMIVPTILTSMWFSVFGGAGLRQQIEAENAGMTCADCLGDDGAYIQGCQLLICRGWGAYEMFFDLLEMYPLRDFMTCISTISLVLYFVTSSDSASSVIDQMSANGKVEGPVWQRVFWAVTEGATAHAVLSVGGADALKSLRSVSIIAALPFCIIMFMMIWGFLRFLAEENDPSFRNGLESRKNWNMNIFDAAARVVMGTLTLGMSGDNPIATSSSLVATPYIQSRSRAQAGGNTCMSLFGIILSFLLLVIFTILCLAHVDGAVPMVGTAWIAFVAVGVANRLTIREAFKIRGTCFGDFFSFLFCGPCAAYQEFMQVESSSDV